MSGVRRVEDLRASRDRLIGLLSTDGPDHKVLKIKPPLVIDFDAVERLLEALDRVLVSMQADSRQPRSLGTEAEVPDERSDGGWIGD